MSKLKKIGIGFGIVIGLLLVPITVSAQTTEIPAWVKGVANFWAEGNISDSEFGESISFLIEQGIIVVDMPYQANGSGLEEKISSLESENAQLRDENISLRNQNSRLQTELQSKTDSKKPDMQNDSSADLRYPHVNGKVYGTDAIKKTRELLDFHNSLSKKQRLEQISAGIADSEFVFVMAYDKKWNVNYIEGIDGISDEGNGIAVIPFDCSHNMNYMQLFSIQKVDEYGLASGLIFKNGVAVSYGSSSKPYGIFAIATFCDTGFDVNETYAKAIVWEDLN